MQPPPPPPAAEAVNGDSMDAEQNTLTLMDDLEGSPHFAGASSFQDAAMLDDQAVAGAENDFVFKGAATNSRPGSAQENHRHLEIVQTATPPTTGSPDIDDAEKVAKRRNFAGMNPERMHQLGLFDESSE